MKSWNKKNTNSLYNNVPIDTINPILFAALI